MWRLFNESSFSRPAASALLGLILAFAACDISRADDSFDEADPAPRMSFTDYRAGGVIDESFNYHRHGAAYDGAAPPSIRPPGGWYGYGFPVPSYRWGWFGASRYYPRVMWHRGYYNDCCRWAYRGGY